MDQTPQLGRLIEDSERRRDAVHVAIAPVTAATTVSPGQHIGLVEDGNTDLVGPCDHNIGIVDPFLSHDVQPGQRFWMMLYPGSITSLRHIWTHSTFSSAAAHIREKLP